MTQKERIEQLERELDVLRARLAALEARPFGTLPQLPAQPWQQTPWYPPTVTLGGHATGGTSLPTVNVCAVN